MPAAWHTLILFMFAEVKKKKSMSEEYMVEITKA